MDVDVVVLLLDCFLVRCPLLGGSDANIVVDVVVVIICIHSRI